MKKNIITSIEFISTLLITSAIALELWNLYAIYTHTHIPNIPYLVFWIGRFALISHAIEGVITAYFAPSRNQKPLRYGIYTFFVGTVGLLKLFDNDGIEKD